MQPPREFRRHGYEHVVATVERADPARVPLGPRRNTVMVTSLWPLEGLSDHSAIEAELRVRTRTGSI